MNRFSDRPGTENTAHPGENRELRGEDRGSAAPESPQETAQRLTTALEDVVALAHSSGETRQRLAAMERRAMAALSGMDRPPR